MSSPNAAAIVRPDGPGDGASSAAAFRPGGPGDCAFGAAGDAPSGDTVPPAARADILGLSSGELASVLADGSGVAVEPFRARQIARWVYERGVFDFAAMTDLGRPLREALAARFRVGVPLVVSRTPADDGAEKLLLELDGGARVESVFIPEGERRTLCVSSQAGCAVDCVFCVTGRMGAGRNLTAGEIVGQYLVVAADRRIPPNSMNVVFMGMGEPLLNVPNVMRALDLLELVVSPRRTTVSTAGVVPGIDALAARGRRPNLAVSLSAPDDATRTRLMPINKTWPLAELFAALARWPLETGRRITFEYVLIAGVNDSPAMARDLARLVRRVPSKVNLIPLNESREWLPGLSRPGRDVVNAFGRTLADLGTEVTVRWSKGLGADAACGQLKGRETPRRPSRGRDPGKT